MGDRPAEPTRRRDLREAAAREAAAREAAAREAAAREVPTSTGALHGAQAPGPRTGEVPTATGSIRIAPVAPEHRRRWLVLTLVGVVVVVLLVVGGPWVYARLVSGPADDPLTLSTPTASPTPTGPPAQIDVDGTWAQATGSQAGYRLDEVLTGAAVTVVGRTDQVTATVQIEGGQLVGATVVVAADSITTDESARDAYFRRALDTSTYPEARFELGAPVDVSAVGTTTEPLEVVVPGTLTLRDASVAVTATLQVQRTLAGVEVAGQVPVTLADFGLAAPDLGFVTVQPTGLVELLLVLER